MKTFSTRTTTALSLAAATGLILCGLSQPAQAGDAATKCGTAKLKAQAKYTACQMKANAQEQFGTNSWPGISGQRCVEKITQRYSRAETRGGDSCLTRDDLAEVLAILDAAIANTSTVTGGGAVVNCGNGVVEGDESCDGSALGGETCESLLGSASGSLACTAGCGFDVSGCVAGGGGGLPATGQTTAYGPGSDGAIQAGCAQSYTDNGDGTITDNCTGLMWEKKDGSGGLHGVNNTYTWCTDADFNEACDDPGNTMDGAIQDFIDELNGLALGQSQPADCFAGYCDWRAPNKNELATLVDNELSAGPTINTAFNQCPALPCSDVTDPACSCTSSSGYWSATTAAPNPAYAWGVAFSSGTTYSPYKASAGHVRAVRAGS